MEKLNKEKALQEILEYSMFKNQSFEKFKENKFVDDLNEITEKGKSIQEIVVENVNKINSQSFSNEEKMSITDYWLSKKKDLTPENYNEPYFIKENASKIVTWSYINENNECENITEQVEYNQSLFTEVFGYKISTFNEPYIIRVNSKLKPLIETLIEYDKDLNILYEKFKIIFVESNEDENLIFIYLESLLPKFECLEIINLDNGMFGIERHGVRVKNYSTIELTIDVDADLEYITEIIKVNQRMFSGIVLTDYKKPEHKYRYEGNIINKIRNTAFNKEWLDNYDGKQQFEWKVGYSVDLVTSNEPKIFYEPIIPTPQEEISISLDEYNKLTHEEDEKLLNKQFIINKFKNK